MGLHTGPLLGLSAEVQKQAGPLPAIKKEREKEKARKIRRRKKVYCGNKVKDSNSRWHVNL